MNVLSLVIQTPRQLDWTYNISVFTENILPFYMLAFIHSDDIYLRYFISM